MNLYHIDILKIATRDWLYLVIYKYLLILRLSLRYGALYKPSGMVGLVKMDLTVC